MISIRTAIGLMTAVCLTATAAAAPQAAPTADTSSQDAEQGRIGITPSPVQIISDNEIIIDGVTYTSWDEVEQTGYFQNLINRCAAHPSGPDIGLRGSGAACSFRRTNVEAQYEPDQGLLRIPIVVHVIQRTNGTGFINEDRVRSQIDILNEDFLALNNSNGEDGDNAQIEFFLATEDPQGNPTNGIT